VTDSVILVAFGGPRRPDEVRPFLLHVTAGRAVPPARLEEVARHYAHLPGGASPLAELTTRQARALETALARRGRPLPVFVGMRHWHPFLHDTLARMVAAGHRRAVALILSVFRTEASWERYLADLERARAATGGALGLRVANPWARREGFLAAVADRCRAALREVPPAFQEVTPLVFTAHSVPVAMAAASPYAEEFQDVAGRVATRLGHRVWHLAYQSRSGSPAEPWLAPDVDEVLRALARTGARHAVVCPLGFVCDHVEVLYDLDVQARSTAEAAGLVFHRAATVNDHPAFIEALADAVEEVAE
jgi:ferrochelatase